MMKLFILFIIIGVVLMLTGVVIAVPSEDIKIILIGAGLCWMALPFLWLASKVQ